MNTTTQKIRSYLLHIILAVVIATAFFIHESLPTMSDKLRKSEANWEAAKSKNATVLGELKQLNFDLSEGNITLEEFTARQPTLVKVYKKINKEKNDLYKILENDKSEARFFQFHSLQYFLGEIGWAAGLFLYALANLLNTFFLKKRYMRMEFTGKMLLHSTLLFVGCFYTFYVFYSEKDFSPVWYFFAMVLCAITLVFASKFIIDTYVKRSAYLKANIERLVAFIFRVRTTHYKKVAIKALYAEKQDTVIDRSETVTENADEFDEDFYKTLQKIDL